MLQIRYYFLKIDCDADMEDEQVTYLIYNMRMLFNIFGVVLEFLPEEYILGAPAIRNQGGNSEMMDMLTCLTVVTISLCLHVSKHFVYLKYMLKIRMKNSFTNKLCKFLSPKIPVVPDIGGYLVSFE